MTTFVFRTDDGDHLGFLLFAKHEGDWPPPGTARCIITGCPFDADLFDDPRAVFILDHKHVEWQAQVSYTEDTFVLRIAMPTGWRLEIVSDPEGNRWMAERDGERVSGGGVFLGVGDDAVCDTAAT